ncbi:hypothetical protein [Streptacidiphilus melanogenes]|uniref:hypothetical protein n=1 Tax=Streptacidiphilus melanogenes TaxID=411235 RepID=UPI0005AA9F0A|nr:hypothetical protein [Streptacidiphilus melanogenes]
MVFTVNRDAWGVVIVTLLAPLTLDDRPVLCRAVEEQLRRPVCHLVLNLGNDPLGPAAVSAVLRIDALCTARGVTRAVVTRDPDRVRRAITDNAPSGSRPEITVTAELATALSAPESLHTPPPRPAAVVRAR